MGVYDVIVVGLGHAGCEAALACARMGRRTLAVTLRRDQIALMSCNPAVGGTAKGHLVREIEALGGEMGRVADATGIQFRRLNASKGPAVRATRVLCDRGRYAEEMARRVCGCPGLEVMEGSVVGLLLEGRRVVGVRCASGEELSGRAVVITTGTFLMGLMHVGETQAVGGRVGDPSSVGLSDSLRGLGLRLGRFKTGTPPRLDGRSIDYGRLAVQAGDEQPHPFSFEASLLVPRLPQRVCHITFTNPRTHEVVRRGLPRSPLYAGRIVGRGPRYCPSLEDKVVRFSDRERHQIFLEPEGIDTHLVYPAGISTSLPGEIQLELLRTIEGLEEVAMVRPGYAVEYDYAPPTQLDSTLKVKGVEGLYLAGQINGSSGYEEAAGQGLVAGVNAALCVAGEPSFVLQRSEAHLGVLVDELVTRGVDEPFRMFTSRSEHRLLLREDNADLRLTHFARRLGLCRPGQWERVEKKREAINREVARLEASAVLPGQEINDSLVCAGSTPLSSPSTLATLLRRPELSYRALACIDPKRPALADEELEEAQTEVKYAGYIERERRSVGAEQARETTAIPGDFCFARLRGLSAEVAEKLEQLRPSTLGQASRIPGMTPVALALLGVHLARAARSGRDATKLAAMRQ